MSQKSVEGFHSDLSIDDRSTLDPTYTSESSVTSSTMSDEMDEPIFDEWDISDLELESEDVGSEEVEVAISVLTLSPTVIGVVLHLLGANLTRRKGKYTSASPRCTCLPSRQICIGVALGDPPQTPLQC